MLDFLAEIYKYLPTDASVLMIPFCLFLSLLSFIISKNIKKNYLQGITFIFSIVCLIFALMTFLLSSTVRINSNHRLMYNYSELKWELTEEQIVQVPFHGKGGSWYIDQLNLIKVKDADCRVLLLKDCVNKYKKELELKE